MDNFTTVVKQIKEMLRSLFYDIQRYVTMGREKGYTPLLLAKCEKISSFETQNYVNYMQILLFLSTVDLVDFVLACFM